jgi:uncharacterized protein YndB with AHSA1/START domain
MTPPPSVDTVHVSVRRFFSAPAERVFDAWLTPRLLGQWMFGPDVRDEKVLRLDVDPRVGGRFSMLVERGGDRIDHVGEYLVIDRPHRLAFTWGIAGESDQDGSRVDIEITPTPGGCELRLTHTLPKAWADYAARTQQGWATMLDALQTVF